MTYRLDELMDNFEKKISGLGVDQKFRENPAYATALAQIKSLILGMNIGDETKNVIVSEEKGNITFDWKNNGDKHSINIMCSNPDTFGVIYVEDKKPYINNEGNTVRNKNVIEKKATIDDAGFITLIENHGMVYNNPSDISKCKNIVWAEKKYYRADGIMRDREFKDYGEGELTESFDNANVGSILYIPREAFKYGFMNDKYEERTVMTRDRFDTAHVYHEDKRKGIEYSATIPLDRQHGLRDMNTVVGFHGQFPEEVIIQPLSKEDIEEMITKEKNTKVEEGLRKLAQGRDTYYYDSKKDPHFKYVGFDNSKGISR